MHAKSAVVLLVEDNPAEQNLARRSFGKLNMPIELHIVSDGEEALDYLFRRAAYSDMKDSPRPDVILLDLNIPKINGSMVLSTIKRNRSLAIIPTIVLTTSKKEEDITRAYEQGCSSFLNKPVDVDDFVKMLDEVASYWLKLVVLPYRGREDYE